jgi:hypothetical protein
MWYLSCSVKAGQFRPAKRRSCRREVVRPGSMPRWTAMCRVESMERVVLEIWRIWEWVYRGVANQGNYGGVSGGMEVRAGRGYLVED